jgi:hypothetical protein
VSASDQLALQMALATVGGPVAAWRLPQLRISWQAALGVYTAGIVLSHVGPLRASLVGGVVLVGAAIALCAGLRDLDPSAWFLYLFAAMPPMDLIASWYLSTGDGDLGVVMIAASLPLGAASLVCAWRWMLEEESRAT